MTPALHPNHRDHLHRSAISDEIINERGYQTVSRTPNDSRGRELLKSLGIPSKFRNEDARYPGILIPLYRPTGERISAQYRCDHPPKNPKNGQPLKYGSPVGKASVVDVHPRNRNAVVDPSVPLWITEGVKKGDALTTLGLCAVSLSGVFNWRKRHGTLGEWEDVALKGRQAVLCFDADANTNPNVARAMDRLGKWLLSKGAASVRYVVTPERVGEADTKGVDDYLAAGGTLQGLLQVAAGKPPEPTSIDLEQTDIGMAETVANEVLDGRFRWASGLGWMLWTGNRWRWVDDKVPTEALRSFLVDRITKALEAKDTKEAKRWVTLTQADHLKTALGLAAGVDGVHSDAADFDQQPDLLNCPNGVVDLTTGDLLPPDPDLLLTKMAAAPYVPGAQHPDWTAALEAVPDDVRSYYQHRCGQGVTGHMPPDDVLIVQQGGGDNGKTTVTAGIAGALGDYYTLLSDRVLLSNPDAHPTELMDLRGARFALIEETPEARRLNVARLKKTVGTPQITARHIRQNSVTFDATHSLFLSSNYRPIIEETDHGTWRRLELMRFPYTYRARSEDIRAETDRLRDTGIRDRVKAGTDGVWEAALAWLVAGAVMWNVRGRVMPPTPQRILDDTAEWRKESDLVYGYVSERLVFDPRFHVMSTELMADFNEHLKAHGHHTWAERTFAPRFGSHAEVVRNKLRKEVTRRPAEWPNGGPELSRQPIYDAFKVRPNVPAQYTAWLGVRFLDDGNGLSEMSSESPMTSENNGAVKGVKGVPYNP